MGGTFFQTGKEGPQPRLVEKNDKTAFGGAGGEFRAALERKRGLKPSGGGRRGNPKMNYTPDA